MAKTKRPSFRGAVELGKHIACYSAACDGVAILIVSKSLESGTRYRIVAVPLEGE